MKHLGFSFECGANEAASTDWQRDASSYRVTFTYDRRRASFDFWQGSGICRDPEAGDVMSCLISDATCGRESFDDFCADLGYDNDSCKAEQTWKACQRVDGQLYHLFGADYAEALERDWEQVTA